MSSPNELDTRVSEDDDEQIALHHLLEFPDQDNLDSGERSVGISKNPLGLYFDHIRRYKVFTPEEERKVFLEYATTSNPDRRAEIRERIINHNLGLVVHVAKRWAFNGREILDIVQDGTLGLMVAIDKFEVHRGYKFSTFAISWIKQSIHRSITNTGSTIRLPAHLEHLVSQVRKVEKFFLDSENREPSDEEVADYLAIPLKRIKVARRHTRQRIVYDLSQCLVTRKGDISDRTLEDMLPDKSLAGTSLRAEAKSQFAELLREVEGIRSRVRNRFGERDVRIYLSRYGLLERGTDKKTLEEVAEPYGMTRERVRQIVHKVNVKIGRSDDEMFALAGRILLLRELVDSDFVSTDSSPAPRLRPKLRLVKPQVPKVEPTHKESEVVKSILVAVEHLPQVERKVFLSFYGLDGEGKVHLVFGEGNVQAIIDRVWARLVSSGFKYNREALQAVTNGHKKD